MDSDSFLVHARLEAEVLETWIEAGWVTPRQTGDAPTFAEIDVARAQLIHELTRDLGVNDEAVSIILGLIDQIHGLRCALRDLLAAVNAQPETLRSQIVAAMRLAASGSGAEGQQG